jgi:hypothetical protein
MGMSGVIISRGKYGHTDYLEPVPNQPTMFQGCNEERRRLCLSMRRFLQEVPALSAPRKDLSQNSLAAASPGGLPQVRRQIDGGHLIPA